MSLQGSKRLQVVPLEYWNIGMMETGNPHRRDGTEAALLPKNIGMMEYWNDGIMEYWDNGMMETGNPRRRGGTEFPKRDEEIGSSGIE
jgi:hypothetical protein